jgi:hypothetical protein
MIYGAQACIAIGMPTRIFIKAMPVVWLTKTAFVVVVKNPPAA